MASTTSKKPATAGRSSSNQLVRLLFLGLLGCWMIFPLMQIGVLAEDAIPFVAAARVDAHQPGSLYSGNAAQEVPDPIREAGCPMAPPGTDCYAFVLPFLSPPQIIPVMKVISALGDEGSLLFMRIVGTGALVGGFWVLWNRVARDNADAQAPVLVAAGLLTPFVYTSAAFGQNAPLMFLSACLGLSATDRADRAFGAASTLVLSILFKLFPLPLLLVALVRRRWKFLAMAVGLLVGLTVITFAFVPTSQYSEFLTTSRTLTAERVTSRWNVSMDAIIYFFYPAWRGEGRAFYAVLATRVAAIAGLVWWKLRDVDDDCLWAYCWVALLAIHPQVWWHYFEIVVPATAYALRGRPGRVWWLVAGSALLVLPLAVITDESTLTVYGPLVIVLMVVGLPFLASSRPAVTAAKVAVA